MKANKEKIEKLFPSVYITLISILLGFAVEDVISRTRELIPLDMYTILTAVAILSCVFAAWTGYSFVSMTQERLPKLLDCVNVFVLAFGIYLLNSTMGMDVWILFAALCFYMGFAMFATVYNFNELLRNLDTVYTWRIFLPNVLLVVVALVVYPVGTWMSYHGMLTPSAEYVLIVFVVIVNSLWTYYFYHAWSKLIHEEV